MRTVLRMDAQGKIQTAYQPTLPVGDALDTRIAVIQALNPLGLQAVAEVLQQEVAALAGPRPHRQRPPDNRPGWDRRAAQPGQRRSPR
jgi:hypothetical protein